MTKHLARVLAILILSLCLVQTSHAQGGPLVVAAGQVVTLSADVTYAGITVNAGGELRFDPSRSVTVSSTANVLVYGKLTMKPSSAATVHILRFTGINETNFVGGGMSPIASDIGLWVMCTTDDDGTSGCLPGSPGGQLDIAGSAKTAWTNAAGSIVAGATQVTLVSTPTGWRVGDTISIAPTEPTTVGNVSWSGFDLRTITAINGAVVTLSSPTTRAHPINTNPFDGAIYSAEVLNLSRNVHVEGMGNGEAALAGNGRAHIFIRSTQPQTIRYLEASHLGPRAPDGAYTQEVLGRYGIHFHMAADGSRGSLVEGVVVRDSGNRAFVPHASHGIIFRDDIAYNTFADAYWWDGRPCHICPTEFINNSNDLLFDRDIAAQIRTDPAHQGYRLSGFLLRNGESLTLQNSVAVGVQGNLDAAGFDWPEDGTTIWDFDQGNVAHNNKVDGIFVWENTADSHVVANYLGYNNTGTGIDHGAYRNRFQYQAIDLFGNKIADISSRAQTSSADPRPDGYGLAFESIRMAGTFMVNSHNQDANAPVLIKDSILAGVKVDEPSGSSSGWYDFVNCVKPDGTALTPTDVVLVRVNPASRWRVQTISGTAWEIGSTGVVTSIAPFYAVATPTPTATPTNTPPPTSTPTPTRTPTPTATNTPTNMPTPTPTNTPSPTPTFTPTPNWITATLVLTNSIDTYLYEFEANQTHESLVSLGAGTRTATNRRTRMLIRYDLSAIPTNAVVVSSTLTLRVMGEDSTTDYGVELRRGLTAWADTVTWNSGSWAANGGLAGTDYSNSVSYSNLIVGTGIFYDFNVLTDTAYFVANPSSNFGWFGLGANEAAINSRKAFASHEGTIPAYWPKLTVTYRYQP